MPSSANQCHGTAGTGSRKNGNGLGSVVQNLTGEALLEAKAYADAKELLHECLLIRQKKEPDAWTTFETLSLLGAGFTLAPATSLPAPPAG